MLGGHALFLGTPNMCGPTNVDMAADEVFCWAANNSSAWQRRSRCYEYCPLTQDVFRQTLEQRDALCFQNEHSDDVLDQHHGLYYKDFAEAKPDLGIGIESKGRRKRNHVKQGKHSA